MFCRLWLALTALLFLDRCNPAAQPFLIGCASAAIRDNNYYTCGSPQLLCLRYTMTVFLLAAPAWANFMNACATSSSYLDT